MEIKQITIFKAKKYQKKMHHISKKYYSQTLLEEYKYEMKKTKMDKSGSY